MKKTNTSNPGSNAQVKKKVSRRKNPLYVVTNQGKVVEQASGPFDAFVKRFGLEPAIKLFNNLLQMLLAQVNSFPALVAFNKWLEQTIKSLELVAKRFAPFLFFYS